MNIKFNEVNKALVDAKISDQEIRKQAELDKSLISELQQQIQEKTNSSNIQDHMDTDRANEKEE